QSSQREEKRRFEKFYFTSLFSDFAAVPSVVQIRLSEIFYRWDTQGSQSSEYSSIKNTLLRVFCASAVPLPSPDSQKRLKARFTKPNNAALKKGSCMKTSIDSARIGELKIRLAESVRICVREELLENFGHVSARDPQSKRIFVLRHLHERLDKVTAKDIIEVDESGRAVSGKPEPPKEVFLHAAIYRKRQDVHAVVYSHPLYSTILGVLG